MLFAIDIGNTNINLGLFQGSRMIKRYKIPTVSSGYSRYLKCLAFKDDIKQAVICSVVPRAAKALAEALKSELGVEPHIIGKGLQVPVKNLYRKPGQVGQDRLVNAYAGIRLFGAPLIVVDFGTAVTFDVISKKGEYLGGMILPGLKISLEALNQKTALLPKVKLAEPVEFIGRDTKNSMLSGIVNGFSALSEELAEEIKKKIGWRAKVIGTGGDIGLIAKHCKVFDACDKDLTLKGLSLIEEEFF